MAAGYAVSPWLVTTMIKSQLAARGVTNVQLQAGYPGWYDIHLNDISAQLISENNKISAYIPHATIEYRLYKLLGGELKSIQVPRITLHAETSTTKPTFATSGTGIPLAVLLSGQWLKDLPVGEIVLDRLDAELNYDSNILYSLQLNGGIHNGKLQLNGEMQQPNAQQPLKFSLIAQDTGATNLSITSVDQKNGPLLEWRVNSAAIAGEQLELTGNCKLQVGRIAPILTQWITTAAWLETVGGDLEAAWQARLPANWDNETGQLQVEGEASLTGVTGHWTIPDTEHAMKLTGGQVTVHGRLTWSKSLQLQGMLRLKNIAAQYREITMTGLNGELPIVIENGLRTRGDARMTIDTFDAGFPVESTDIRFELIKSAADKLPVLSVKHFNSHLLGGEVRIEPFEFDVARDKNIIVLQMSQLSLAKIIELERQEGITGDGLLDGRIPLEFSGKEIVVTEGKLSAREPGGVIRYTPTERIAALANSNMSVDMMVKALSNFQYRVLDVISNYNPNGDLSLQVRLEGMNPDWQGGQPINLNLNLQENIPALLRSLQLSDEISEKVRKHYQETP